MSSRSRCLLIFALTMLLVSAAAAEDTTSADDFRSYVDQARFFMKKSWYADAEEQLELAVSTEDGRLDPETWFLLATVRYQLTELAEARDAADRALVSSRSEEQTRQAKEFLSFLDQKFGMVALTAPRTGTLTKIDITLESLIFDPQLKEYFNKLTARMSDKITLPYSVGLPAGTYTINGDEVHIAAGTTSDHAISVQTGGVSGLQQVELELSGGVRTFFSGPAPQDIPALDLELSLHQPVGIWVFGGAATWTAHPIQSSQGITVAPTGWSVGGRFGVESQGDSQVAVRPAVTARYGAVPGIELACEPGSVLSCVPSFAGTDARRVAYGIGHAAMIGAETAIIFRNRTAKSGFGAGLKTSIDGLFGGLPTAGDSLPVGGEPARAFEIDDNDRAWSAVGLRVHFGISYAF